MRGIIHPVVDLNQKFGMQQTKTTKETCIIVVTAHRNGTQEQVGILVDAVSEVEDISSADIEDAPNLGSVNTKFIEGIAKTKGSVKMLLDLENALGDQDLDLISAVNQKNNK